MNVISTTPATDTLVTTTIDTPVGPLTLQAGTRGLRRVMWLGEHAERLADDAHAAGGRNPAAEAVLAAAVTQLREYFAGTRHEFDLPLDPVGTPFQQQVWQVLRGIPYGETISYGEQARRLGDVRKSRAVGAANGKNPLGIIVPCHRVVGSDGKLTGFAGGLENKAWLLQLEQSDRTPTLSFG